MKIYFEDGELKKNHGILEDSKKITICDAKKGISFCNVTIGYCVYNYIKGAVYTNSVCGLNPEYSWNGKSKECELFMRDECGRWVKAESLLKDHERLTFSSDIVGMYLKGRFKRKEYAV